MIRQTKDAWEAEDNTHKGGLTQLCNGWTKENVDYTTRGTKEHHSNSMLKGVLGSLHGLSLYIYSINEY